MTLQLLAFLGTFGLPEIALILLILVLLFGAKKLPKLARGFGQAQGEFKKARSDAKREMEEAEKEAE
ncbi:MAG: twin-arginine translocase TatA/TatE family subunit [Verrucomicrobiales bacterium]|jgi:sec-independent protein translocase protein TatA